MIHDSEQRSFISPWSLLAAVLLALAGVLAFLLIQQRARVTAREEERLLAQTRVVELLLNEQLASLDSVLRTLGEDWTVRRSGRDFNNRLVTLTRAMPGVRTLNILDRDGVIRASNRPEVLNGDFHNREYFTLVKRSPDPDMTYLNPPYTTSLGVHSINVCRMVNGPDGGFGGLLSATLDPKFFAPLLESTLYSPDMWTGIVHSGGKLFMLRPEKPEVVGKDLARPGTFFSRHLDSGRETSVFSGHTYATGEQRMLALRTVHPAGLKLDNTLLVYASRDLDAIYAGWRADLLRQTLLFAFVVLASCFALHAYERRKKEYDRRAAQAALALRDSERFMRTVADNIPGMVGYWDTELRCRFANRTYLEWFGRTPEEMRGLDIRELMGTELYQKNEPFISAALSGQAQHFERALKKRDGSIGFTLAHYVPDIVDGVVRGFFVLVADVTELKNTQLVLETRVEERTTELRQTVAALEVAKVQAESVSRLKSDFLANLSHELRTPLNPMITLTGLLLGTVLDAQQREYLEEVQKASLRLLALFNRLIELVELENYKPTSAAVNLTQLKDQILTALAPTALAKRLALTGQVAPELPQFILLDFTLLRMAVMELVENAVRFTGEGSVRCNIAQFEETGGKRWLQVTVADTGMGIPEERVAAIFTGLTQGEAALTRRFGGLGIGLVKARKAVELSGGRLELDSSTGQGTVFRILLPFEPLDLLEEGGAEYVCGPDGACSWSKGAAKG